MRQELQPGTVLEGFTLRERMPSGGMASLWRASPPEGGPDVVLKIPFLHPGADVSTIIGFEAEAMILKRLSGPHVPRFIASGDLKRTPFIAMEFVEGESLAKRASAAPLPAAAVVELGVRIAEALASVHRQKVVHLDLKPENVILAARGAVLLDFGLARHAELPDLLGEESSVPMGSAAFIAPEQVLGERTDPASDIFALGCILYLLATAELPFGEPATVAGMRRRLFHAPRRPRALDAKIPRWLERIVLRCLEVDRSKRYGQAEQILFDLKNPDQVPVPPDSGGAGEGVWEKLGRLFRRTDFSARIGRATVRRRQAGPGLVLAAVDLANGRDALAEAVLGETARVLGPREDSRLACVTVLKTEILGDTPLADAEGRSIYLKRLVALKDWARPLRLPDDRVSFHVLEAVSPADAILDYAERNGADHIVLGARASSALRRHLGSVSTKVVAEALCSVSVVRLPPDGLSPR